MLTKILSSESQSIQKANRRLPAAKFFKCAITFLVFVCAFSVSAFAYTESTDGVDTVYTFPFVNFSGGTTNNYIVEPAAVSYRFQGNAINYNGGVDYNNLTRYRYTNVRADTNTKNLLIYASIPLGFVKKLNTVDSYWSLTTDVSSNALTVDGSFEIYLELYIPMYQLSGYNNDIVDRVTLFCYNSDSQVFGVHPTIVDTSVIYSNTASGNEYDMIKYSLVFVIDNVDYSTITFNSFKLSSITAVDLLNPTSTVQYFSMYSLGIGDITVCQLADEQVREYYQAISAGNNDLKQYFGTVNQVDQEIINTQKDKISQVGSSTSQLGLTSQLEESLSGQFDISQEVDVLGNSAVLGSVSNFWDLVPWDSMFVTTAIGMVGSIALLSLVLHAGGRGGALRSGGNNRNNSRKGNDE